MWLIFFLAIAGVVVGTMLFHVTLLKSALTGAAVALALVFVVNIVSPTVCLQQAKSWRIFVAYKVC